MKYLSQYIAESQTKALKKAGAFFAFSNKQFDEQKKPKTVYVNGPAGMICPKNTLKTLMDELDAGYKAGIAEDIAENGLEAIIKRELNNHEAYYTGDSTDTAEALADYPITKEDINKVFHNKNYKLTPLTL